MQMMSLLDSPTYRLSLANRLEQEKERKNNGTIPGGLASMLDTLNASYQRHRDEQDRTGAMQAFRAGMGEGAPIQTASRDGQQPNAPQMEPGIDAAASRLGGMADNPYAGRLSMQLAMTQAEQRQAAEAARQQFEQQLMRDQMNNDARIRASAAGRSSVNVNTGNSGPQIGTIPPGFQVMRDPATGAYRMEPIPGSNAEQERQTAAAANVEKKSQKAYGAENVLSAIDAARNIVATSSVPVTGLGSLASAIPGTPAHDLSALLNTIKSNVGFDRLQAMRDASPTGGALGAVSETENRLLQSTVAALEQSQSQEQFLRNMDRVKQTYDRIINGPPQSTAPGIGGITPLDQPSGAPPGNAGADGWITLPNGTRIREKR